MTMNPALPNLSTAVNAWIQKLSFVVVTKQTVNFQVIETYTPKTAYGVRVPMKPQELILKPEGQRAWKWEQIFATPSLILNIEDIIEFNNTRYRVMGKQDFAEYGYIVYDIVQGFTTT